MAARSASAATNCRYGLSRIAQRAVCLSGLGIVFYEPLRFVHLQIERRSERYAQMVQKYHPRYRRGWRWVRKLEPAD